MLCLLLWLSLLCCSYLSSPHTGSCSALERFGLNAMHAGRKGDTQGGNELCTHGKRVCTQTTFTYSNSMANQSERASARLPTWLTRPHSQPEPPFCASPPSQKANPSILCFPSLIDSSLHHFVPPLPHMKQPPLFSASKESAPSILCLPSLTGGSCLPQARYQEGLQP